MTDSKTNPNDLLFDEYVKTTQEFWVEITTQNIHEIARHFNWIVEYRKDEDPVMHRDMQQSGYGKIFVGQWVSSKGERSTIAPERNNMTLVPPALSFEPLPEDVVEEEKTSKPSGKIRFSDYLGGGGTRRGE